MQKKDKKKLALTAEGAEQSGSLDDTLDKSVAIPTGSNSGSEILDTSNFIAKVAADVSLDAAKLQNRSTPIDFGTREVVDDDDIFSVQGGRRRNETPSPIPEEPEAVPPTISPVFQTPKPRKQAKVYYSPESSPIQSMKSRSSSNALKEMYKGGKLTPVIGGSLRPPRSRRHSVAFDESQHKFYSLDRRCSNLRLRKRDSSRRDAVEAGFEPRDAVPRCHSTQSLREVQRVKAYSNSQFQASDLSLNPNGRVLAACDSTSGSVAPTAIVNPAQSQSHRHLHHHQHQHHSSYDRDIAHQEVDRRRSLQTLTGASSLYQMTNGGSNGRSQFSPSELNGQVHNHVGSRVRVGSTHQLCDTTSTPQFSIDQRRSVHIGNPIRNSFADGIKSTSTPKNQIAVAPIAHKSRHLSESRDEMRSERRGSGAGAYPAYNQMMLKNQMGEERLVDGPINTNSEARIAYLEKRIQELELGKEQSVHSTPNQSRYSKSSHLNGSLGMSTSEQLRMQEMNDELAIKDRKVTSLESKLLKAYQRIEKINEEYEGKIKTLMYDGEHARDNLTRCVDKIHQLECELDNTRLAAQNGDHANEQEYHELRDKMWKQERELQESRTLLARMREKEAEFERMRSEKGYLELKNENLNKKLEAKKRAVEELERSVSSLRLEQTICQQSCSSGSTPLADEMETMSDIRPSLARPYQKAHSTMGSHMSPLSRSKSGGLTKSISNFGLNTAAKRDDITPMMSRMIREQNRHVTMCRAMVVCLKDTVDRMARGENPDVARLLGVKLNVMSESEMEEEEDDEADESKPFSMMAAESALSKQCTKLSELDKDLDTIRCQLADWHGQTNMEGEGDRDVCRVQ